MNANDVKISSLWKPIKFIPSDAPAKYVVGYNDGEEIVAISTDCECSWAGGLVEFLNLFRWVKDSDCKGK
jgi:hypothetical protein